MEKCNAIIPVYFPWLQCLCVDFSTTVFTVYLRQTLS